MKQSEVISRILDENQHDWKMQDGQYVIPDADSVDVMLKHLKKQLIDNNVTEGQIESGGILVRIEDGHFDVFTYVGELDTDDLTD